MPPIDELWKHNRNGNLYTVIGVTSSGMKARGLQPNDVIIANEFADAARRDRYPKVVIVTDANGMPFGITSSDIVTRKRVDEVSTWVVYRDADERIWAKPVDSFLDSMSPASWNHTGKAEEEEIAG